MSTINLLIFADIVGRPGRDAVKAVLPKWKEAHNPVLTIANFENLAHGAGMTARTVEDMFDAGIDVATGGNHTWDRTSLVSEIWSNKEFAKQLVRPLNETRPVPGDGLLLVERDGVTFAFMNVMGTIFFPDGRYDLPLPILESRLADIPDGAIVLLDIHAEATSEKAVLGRYFDGRIHVVWGSHTHVPTADERILPLGTAFITDIGQTGAFNEAIGLSYEQVLPAFHGDRMRGFGPPENTDLVANALLVTLEPETTCVTAIQRLREILPRG